MEMPAIGRRPSWSLYGTLLAVSLVTKCQMITESALNPLQFVSEQWIGDCYSTADNTTVVLLQSSARAVFYVGSAISTVLTAILPDLIGRQKCLLLCCLYVLLSSGGAVVGIVYRSYPAYVISRLVNGVAFGHGTAVATMFANEISPVESRGRLVGLLHVALTVADLLGATMGIPQVLGTADRWVFVFAVGGLLAVVALPVLMFTPDSPRHLAITKRNLKAGSQSLRYFRGIITEEQIQTELAEMAKEFQLSRSTKQLRLWTLITTKSYRKALLLTSLVSLSLQLTGAMPILSYTTAVWVESGITIDTAQLATLAVTAGQPVCCTLSAVFVERTGRKTMLQGGLVAAIVSLSAHSALALIWRQTTIHTFAIATLGALGSYAVGYAAVAVGRWTIPGELHPQTSRSTAVAFGDALYWLTSVFTMFAFIPWLYAVGPTFVFFPFIALTLITIIILWRYLPETSGKTVDEITEQLGFYVHSTKLNSVDVAKA